MQQPQERLWRWPLQLADSTLTWLSHSAAGVLGRGEYAAVLTLSKPMRRTSSSVRKYCSSVSPVHTYNVQAQATVGNQLTI